MQYEWVIAENDCLYIVRFLVICFFDYIQYPPFVTRMIII